MIQITVYDKVGSLVMFDCKVMPVFHIMRKVVMITGGM